MNPGDLVRCAPMPAEAFTLLGMVRDVAPKQILVEDEDDHVLWWPRRLVRLEVSEGSDASDRYDHMLDVLRDRQRAKRDRLEAIR